ncbi:MAG: molybdate ABC transporter substrate-binding protein [Usitatibacter sp.]
MTLEFISAGAAQGIVARIASEAGVEIAGSFGAVGAMLERFNAGADCDIVILTRKQIDELAVSKRVAAGSIADLGSVPTAVAVRSADPAPDVSSGDGLRAALLAADAIYFPDPAKSTAGIHFTKVVDLLGVRGRVDRRFKTYPNGATAMRALSESAGHPIGCTQSTEILATPGVKLVAFLPRGFELSTVYTAAVGASAKQPQAAADFIAMLTGAATRNARAAAGFQ